MGVEPTVILYMSGTMYSVVDWLSHFKEMIFFLQYFLVYASRCSNQFESLYDTTESLYFKTFYFEIIDLFRFGSIKIFNI